MPAQSRTSDPNHPNVFYFVTTATFTTPSRLSKVTFTDIEQPTLGGTVELLLNGGDGVQTVRMMDNMTIDADGDLIIQEDPGGNPHSAKIWM